MTGSYATDASSTFVNSPKAGDNDQPYVYDGERNEKGDRHGKGKATLPNGDTYEGEYKNGVRHGYGEYLFYGQNSAKYVGYYADNKKNGHGVFHYPDGSKYDGSWRDDKRHGKGTYWYSNGDIYTGEWSGDNRHGYGEYKYCSEDMAYKGTWRNGKRSGEGQLIFNDNFYQGHFRHDKMLGPGRYIFKNGSEQIGEYVVEQNKESNDASNSTDSFVTEWRCKEYIPGQDEH